MNKKIVILVSFSFVFFIFDFISKDLNIKKVSDEGVNIKEVFEEANGDFKNFSISNIKNIPSGWVVFKGDNIKNGGSVVDSAKNIYGGDVSINKLGKNGFVLSYGGLPSGYLCEVLLKSQIGVGWNNYSVLNSEKEIIKYDLSSKDEIKNSCAGDDRITVLFKYNKS